jgi:hypothetical protein
MLERGVSTLRPLTVRRKGFAFDRVTPHAGLRHARVTGSCAISPTPRAHLAANAIAHVEACHWGLAECDGWFRCTSLAP